MKTLLKLLWHLLALVGLATAAGAIWFAAQGSGTRTPPGAIETTVARAARHASIPAAARQRQSPEPPSPQSIRAGLEHWADHCAACHANDGGGDTEMGRGLYPRAPDMRLPATQQLSDGELFHIIENGVKLTGMPAWGTGTPDGELASWHLVHFIRHLPKLTEDELADMTTLNPRSLEEWQAYDEERRFLAGGTAAPPVKPGPKHEHK
jgi:mono/diheme cytochrome c family protein